MYQLVRGLADVTAQERILESAAQVEGGELSLTRVIKLAEAFEMGKSSQELVNSAGQVSKISDHQLKKRGSRQESRQANNTTRQSKSKDTQTGCGNCGRSDHTSRLSDRLEKCPAFDKSCSKCQINGHFAQQCRTKPKSSSTNTSNTRQQQKPKVNSVIAENTAANTNTAPDADLSTLSVSWMLIQGRQEQNDQELVYPNLSQLQEKQALKKIRHHIFDSFGRWRPSNVEPHGLLQLTMESCHSATQQLRLLKIPGTKPVQVNALVDTGVQICVADYQLAKQMGLRKKNMLTPALTISVADNADLELIRAAFMNIKSPEGFNTINSFTSRLELANSTSPKQHVLTWGLSVATSQKLELPALGPSPRSTRGFRNSRSTKTSAQFQLLLPTLMKSSTMMIKVQQWVAPWYVMRHLVFNTEIANRFNMLNMMINNQVGSRFLFYLFASTRGAPSSMPSCSSLVSCPLCTPGYDLTGVEDTNAYA